jgi:hypothetical protein
MVFILNPVENEWIFADRLLREHRVVVKQSQPALITICRSRDYAHPAGVA